jgi:hypothetical protein
MPCGGIFPIDEVPKNYVTGTVAACWHCGKADPPPDHILIEWDSYLHGVCVKPFLKTEEGRIVLNHRHIVEVRLPDGTIETVQEET